MSTSPITAPPEWGTRTLLTRDGARALAEELARLRHQLDVEFAARLRDTRSFGEAHNNDDYLQIKEEETVLTARVRQLETLLDSGEIVDDEEPETDLVQVGSLVEVKDLRTGTMRRHRLAGGFEPLGGNQISANSPVGRALLNRRPGEEVGVELPTGRSLRLKILAVDA